MHAQKRQLCELGTELTLGRTVRLQRSRSRLVWTAPAPFEHRRSPGGDWRAVGPPFLVRTHWHHGRPEVCDPSSRTSNQHRLDCAQVPCSVVLLLLCFDFVLLSKLLIPRRSVLWFSKPIVQRTHQHATSCCIFTVFSAKTENCFLTKLILS